MNKRISKKNYVVAKALCMAKDKNKIINAGIQMRHSSKISFDKEIGPPSPPPGNLWSNENLKRLTKRQNRIKVDRFFGDEP